ncbi:MAG: hypothetical protein IH600_03290 [Bacteroidetes bacterium]|nr:hypothetical protein [Bacteroidota bacterium]
MRTTIVIVLMLVLTAGASAQFKKGNFELMLSGTAGSFSENFKYTSKTSELFNDESDESHTYAYLSFMPSWYIIDGLSAEVELGLRAMEGSEPTQAVILNASYTHALRKSPVAFFARAGYGISNGYSVPIFYELVGRTDGFDINIINLGAGLKIRTGGSGLIRAEINYRIQSYTTETALATYDHTYGALSLMLGVGVML